MLLSEVRVITKRRPIIPRKVKLLHRKQYRRTKAKRKQYMRRYLRRPRTKLLSRIRRRAKKLLGPRVKRLKVFLR